MEGKWWYASAGEWWEFVKCLPAIAVVLTFTLQVVTCTAKVGYTAYHNATCETPQCERAYLNASAEDEHSRRRLYWTSGRRR